MADLAALLPTMTLALAVLLIGLLLIALAVWLLIRQVREQRRRRRIDDMLQELAERRLALRDTEVDRSRFLAAFSHDLKQPMQAINLYLGSVERSLAHASLDTAERSRATESLLRLRQSMGYMNDVFDSMLDVSRLDSGALEVSIERIDGREFCERIVAQHRRMAEDLGLTLTLRAPDHEVLFLQTDPRLLERILRNFISNSMRYTQRGGVRIRISRRGERCRIAVIDTGAGIAAGLRKKIFDEFTRGDHAAMTTQGVGLGLAIARRLAARIGARISLSSHVGIGSVFAIDLPLVTEAITGSEQVALAETYLIERLLPQVLLEPPENTLMVCIDADPDVGNALRLLAPGIGISVVVAGSSDDAIRQLAIQGGIPSLLMVDAQMQSEPVAQVITRMNDEFNSNLPVLLCSDESPFSDLQRQVGSRVTLLQRPFSTEKLRAAINATLFTEPE
ncbi:BaeS Signal transduction histidine kinase [Oxalobacteraceae bacterium]|nr:HAMP domain-containing histidine kinase [Oxalobacteraceae bacterium]